MACSVLKSLPDSLFICVVVVMVLFQYMPRFHAVSVGLILSFPIFTVTSGSLDNCCLVPIKTVGHLQKHENLYYVDNICLPRVMYKG